MPNMLTRSSARTCLTISLLLIKPGTEWMNYPSETVRYCHERKFSSRSVKGWWETLGQQIIFPVKCHTWAYLTRISPLEMKGLNKPVSWDIEKTVLCCRKLALRKLPLGRVVLLPPFFVLLLLPDVRGEVMVEIHNSLRTLGSFSHVCSRLTVIMAEKKEQ